MLKSKKWVVLRLVNGLKMILKLKLNKQYMIGLTQEPFDTNDDGRTDGWTDRRGSQNSYLDLKCLNIFCDIS